MEQHGRRFEDLGFGRLLKYWPYLIVVFTGGAWYESSRALADIVDRHEQRLTKVEEAVVYLKTLVELREGEKPSGRH